MKRFTFAAVTALLVLAPWHGTVRATAPLYTVQDLGNFNGLAPTIAGVNASGQVAGSVTNPDGSMQAVRYTGGVWQAVPGTTNPFAFSVASGINDGGDVVGYYVNDAGALRAFRFNNGTGLVDDIEPLAGGSVTFGFAINAAGTVVGGADQAGATVAFRADPGMPAVVLPALNTGFAYACGINAAGQIAGYATPPAGGQHGTRLNPGALSALEIESLDGPGGFVTTCAIDAAGRVGGQADHGGLPHAFRYTDGGSLDLDVFGSSQSNVESISEGLSVGRYRLADGSDRAFAHRDGDGSFDLNTRISDAAWVLNVARAVNVSGVIAGEGMHNDAPAVFLLTPVGADTTAPVISSVSATPSLVPVPNNQLVNVMVSVNATDDSGNAACSLESISGPAADVAVTGQFTGKVRAVSGQTYTLSVVCVDAANNASHAATSVTVANDTTAPVISLVSATPSNISPADGRTVAVAVSVSATDNSTLAPSCSVTGVTGGAANASVTGPLAVSVKANSGASYTVSVQCSDASGNSSNGATAVTVVTAPPPPPPPHHDTKAPVIRFLYAQRSETKINGVPWENVRLYVFATDNVDHSPYCSITSVTGAPAGSYAVTGRLTARLREQRSLGDLNRTYVLNVSCVDDDGNTARATVSIDPDGRTTYSGDNRRWRW